MADRITGAPMPAKGGVRLYDVVYPTPERPLDVAFLSAGWIGVNTHWIPGGQNGRGRSRLCLHPYTCSMCSPESIDRWIGYAPVYQRSMEDGRMIVALGADAVDAIHVQLRGKPMIGSWWKFTRKTKNAHSPVIAQPHPSPPNMLHLPSPMDLLPTLSRLYGPRLREVLEALSERESS